jgi:hypothetical protein
MISSARRSIARFLLIWLTTGFLCASASAQYSSRGSEVRVPGPNIPADAKDIVLKGELVCLRRVPEPSGRVLLDCAIGLRGDDDQFYGLRAADPSRINSFPEMNARVRVTGKLIPQSGGRYEEVGQIVYATIESIDAEPKPVEGTFMCITPSTSGAAAVAECRNVVKTDRGLYWGLDMPSLDAIPAARGLSPGDRVTLEADILRNVPDDWHSWMSYFGRERIEGVLKVRHLTRPSPR